MHDTLAALLGHSRLPHALLLRVQRVRGSKHVACRTAGRASGDKGDYPSPRSPKRAAVKLTTQSLLAKANWRLPGSFSPFCAAAQLYLRRRLKARIYVLLQDFLADDVPLAQSPLPACSLALVLLTLALAFDVVTIQQCSCICCFCKNK